MKEFVPIDMRYIFNVKLFFSFLFFSFSFFFFLFFFFYNYYEAEITADIVYINCMYMHTEALARVFISNLTYRTDLALGLTSLRTYNASPETFSMTDNKCS